MRLTFCQEQRLRILAKLPESKINSLNIFAFQYVDLRGKVTLSQNTKHYQTVAIPTIFFSQSWDEFLGRDDSDFLLLRGDAVKQVGQTGEEGLLTTWLHLKKKRRKAPLNRRRLTFSEWGATSSLNLNISSNLEEWYHTHTLKYQALKGGFKVSFSRLLKKLLRSELLSVQI